MKRPLLLLLISWQQLGSKKPPSSSHVFFFVVVVVVFFQGSLRPSLPASVADSDYQNKKTLRIVAWTRRMDEKKLRGNVTARRTLGLLDDVSV